ncbi:MAG TPA: hypothetical protein VK756_05375 [Solirubrobacteraceae bacterium]|nr:hypothetical protein [Solirubrobacteraceae bacterium]
MSLRRVVRALVAHHRLTRLDPRDQAQALKLVEDPVDARAAHRAPTPAQRVLDLQRRQRARLARQQLQQRAPRAAALAARRRQRAFGALDPRAT